MARHMTPPPTDPSHEDIIWLAGPRLLGILFNWGLLGILTTQLYIYYLNFPKDRRAVKFLVYTLYLLDWAQTCSATYDAFQWFVYGWGDIHALYDLFTGFLNIPILSSTVAGAVQIFFGWRIWMFSGSKALFIFVIALALLQLGGGAAVAYFIYNDTSEVARSTGLVRAVGIRLGGSAVVDTVIATSMTYFLLRSKDRAVGRMNNVLTRLIRLTIETGTLTAIAAIVDLVFFLRAHNALHQVSGVILAKLYSNTLLAIFNNRMVMAGRAARADPHGRTAPQWQSLVFDGGRAPSDGIPLDMSKAAHSQVDSESGGMEMSKLGSPAALEEGRGVGQSAG